MTKSKSKLTPKMEAMKWKKGQPSPNPQGARLHSPEQKAMKKLTLETYREVIELALTGNLAALKAFVENPNSSAVQVGVATAILKSIKEGDPTVLERFAERIVGKIPDIIQINSNNTTSITAQVAQLTDEQIKLRLAKLREDV